MTKPTVARDWRPAFLRSLAGSGIVGIACKAARIERAVAFAAREAEPTFATQWDAAEGKAYQRLVQEARRRGIRV